MEDSKTNKLPKLVKSQPTNYAILSKLITENNIKSNPSLLTNQLPKITDEIKEKIKHNDDILDLFPDIELCIEIMTASILAPNDYISSAINFRSPDNIKLPESIKSTLIKIIEDELKVKYKFIESLPNRLRESLFTKGAYIEAVIPEAAVDEVINKKYDSDGQVSIDNISLESISKLFEINNADSNFGLFNNSTNNTNFTEVISLEKFENLHIRVCKDKDNIELKEHEKQNTLLISSEDIGIDISDNYGSLIKTNVLKELQPSIIKNKLKNKFKNKTSLSKEDREDFDHLFKNKANNITSDFIYINTKDETSRTSLGRPMVYKLPVEAVTPVHVVNDPSKHLGYFVSLDENGTPIVGTDDQIINDPFSNMMNNQDSTANLLTKAMNGLNGMTKSSTKLSELEKIYNVIVDKMIKNKLANSEYKGLADISETTDLYRVMFTRALKSRRTKLIFIPKELVSYYAFEYRENGTGKSLLEKNHMVYSIRAILLMGRIMSTIKNSVPITKVSATLDEDIVDPSSARESIISNAMNAKAASFPIGLTNMNELVNWSRKLGMVFDIKGGGEPEFNIEISNENANHFVPDDSLDTILTKRSYMGFGLTPEQVDSGYNPDFASTFAAKNLLTAKRNKEFQNKFIPMVNDNIRLILDSDDTLQEKLRSTIRSNLKVIKDFLKIYDKNTNKDKDLIINDEIETINKKSKDDEIIEYILEEYIREVYIEIPEAETNEAPNMKNAFNDFKDTLTDAIDLMFPAEVYNDTNMGKSAESIDSVKALIKLNAIKKFLADNKYLDELNNIIIKDNEGNTKFPALEEFLSIMEPFAKTLSEFKIKSQEVITETNKLFDNIENTDDNLETNNDSEINNDNDGIENTGDELNNNETDDLGGDDNNEELGDDLKSDSDNIGDVSDDNNVESRDNDDINNDNNNDNMDISKSTKTDDEEDISFDDDEEDEDKEEKSEEEKSEEEDIEEKEKSEEDSDKGDVIEEKDKKDVDTGDEEDEEDIVVNKTISKYVQEHSIKTKNKKED